MIYYDAPWDNKIKEPVPAISKEDVKEDNKAVNTELILAGVAFVGVVAIGYIFVPEIMLMATEKVAEAMIALAPLASGL